MGRLADRYNRIWGQDRTEAVRFFVNCSADWERVPRSGLPSIWTTAPNVQLLTPTHPVQLQLRRDKLEAVQPIVIGNNVWIGGGAIVLPGVTVGGNSVIGAGAVVTRDVPADVVVVGNPARVIREL